MRGSEVLLRVTATLRRGPGEPLDAKADSRPEASSSGWTLVSRGACLAWLAFALAACTPVLSEEPVGSAAFELAPDAIEGVWVMAEEPGQLQCGYVVQRIEPEAGDEPAGAPADSAGRFRMISVGEDGGKLSAFDLDGRFMEHNGVVFASIAKSARNAPELLSEWRSGYFFGVVEFVSRDEIHLFLPKHARVEQSVKEGLLPAGETCGEGSVCLGRLERAHLDFLTAPDCLDAHFDSVPIVFRRFPFSIS